MKSVSQGDVPMAEGDPSAITALGFDVGILCTACVKVRGEKAVSFFLLNREKTKVKLETLQDELLSWVKSPEIQGALEGVTRICIEKHYAGMRPTHTQVKLRMLEFTLRQYFRETAGLDTRMVWAATYKKHFKVCKGGHAENKKLARKIALEHVIDPDKHPNLPSDRYHDLGDAYLVALYATKGNLRVQE